MLWLLILFINVPFSGTGTSLVILNISALLGAVRSHFLVVRDANSFSLPQRVARSCLIPLPGKRLNEEPLGRWQEAENSAAMKGNVWGRNEIKEILSVVAITETIAAWGPAEYFLLNDTTAFCCWCFGNIEQNIRATYFIHIHPTNVFIEHPLSARDFYVHCLL